MSRSFYSAIERIARHEARARATAGLGRVVEIFPSDGAQLDYAVTVEMRDTGLLLPAVPLVTGILGFAAIPDIDDLVLVVFLEGEFNSAVVVGRVYHPDKNPPKHSENQMVLRLPSGTNDPNINFEINYKEPNIQLSLPGDVQLQIAEEKILIKVGKLKLSIDGTGSGRTEIEAGTSKISLKEDGDIAISSSTKLSLNAQEIEISGQARVKISGSLVEIN